MSEKKATDIILELQEQVKYLSKLVFNQDNNIKLIIKKLNSLEKVGSSPKVSDYYLARDVSETQQFQQNQTPQQKFLQGSEAIAMKAQHAKQQHSMFEQAAAGIGVDVSENSQTSNSINQNGINLSEAKEFSGQARGRRVDRAQKNNPVTVTQLLVIPDNSGALKPLPLAIVKITDKLGQTVKSSRSNTKGRWNVPLLPGEYNVEITKKFAAEANKKPVEMRFNLIVTDNGTGKMEIPSPSLEG